MSDGVELYSNTRYMSISEEFWCFHKFNFHCHYSSVMKLLCHLKDEEWTMFREGEAATAERGPPKTKLMLWMELNKSDSDTPPSITSPSTALAEQLMGGT